MEYDLDKLTAVMGREVSGRGCGKSVADAFMICHRTELSPTIKDLIVIGRNRRMIDDFINSIFKNVIDYLDMHALEFRSYWIVEDTRVTFYTRHDLTNSRLYGRNFSEIYYIDDFVREKFDGTFYDREAIYNINKR